MLCLCRHFHTPKILVFVVVKTFDSLWWILFPSACHVRNLVYCVCIPTYLQIGCLEGFHRWMYVLVCLCNLHCMSLMSHVMICICLCYGKKKTLIDGWICLFLKLTTAKYFLSLSSSCCDVYSPVTILKQIQFS